MLLLLNSRNVEDAFTASSLQVTDYHATFVRGTHLTWSLMRLPSQRMTPCLGRAAFLGPACLARHTWLYR